MIYACRFILIITMAALLSNAASAQEKKREALRKEILQSNELIFRGDYDEALKRFSDLSMKYPECPCDFYQAVALTWKSYVDGRLETGKRVFDQQINALLDATISKAEAMRSRADKSKEDEIEALYYLGSAYSMRSRLNVFQNNAIPAARAARAAQDYLEELIKLAPDLSDAYFTAGSIYYRTGLLTDSPLGKVAISMLGARSLPTGDRRRGIDYITIAAQKGSLTTIDARLALIEVFTLNENRFEEALSLTRELHSRYPDNQTFARYLLRIYMGIKDRANLTRTAQTILSKAKEGKPNFGPFMIAEAEKYLVEARKL
jgi:tetratricopeptide (TPR) repeat protein